ncbi:LysR family transcriptional regulator [Pseudogemmobacter sonorensis]|uniref:LysR family transcriptional regulator n=1 Tax=Pseudogemmobacter sonorensis TaxID=2989681 RepID=UPI0036B7C1C6
MQLSFRALLYMVETAEAGSVTGAARRLNVTQPSISAVLAQVEKDLGYPVFVRHHARGMTLSAAGERLIAEARRLLTQAREFEQLATSLGDPLSGEIHVGAFSSLAMRYMPGLIAGFSRLYPQITIRLVDGNQQVILDGLTSGGIELALSYDFALSPDLDAEELAALPPYALLAADHPLAHAKSLSLAELAHEPLILLDLPHSRDYFLGHFAQFDLTPRIAFRSQSSEIVRGLVGNGLGYALRNVLPQSRIGYDGSEISVVQIEEPLEPVRINLLHLSRSELRPAARAFSDFIRSAFASGGLFAQRPGPFALHRGPRI